MRLIVVGAAAAVLVVGSPAFSAGTQPGTSDAACSRGQTATVVRSFIKTVSRGDVAAADRLWAAEPDFQWYFVDDEREQDAEDRATLRSYFALRIALNDRVELRRLGVSREGTDFAFKLHRTTDDDRPGAAGLFHGKGAASESLALPTIAEPIPAVRCLLTMWAMDNHRE